MEEGTKTIGIKINGEAVEIKPRRISLFCHDGNHRIEPNDDSMVMIDPEQTAIAARRLTEQQLAEMAQLALFKRYWSHIWGPERPIPATQVEMSLADAHVIGLLILTQYALICGLTPYWKFPETYLHPKQQTGLADVVIHMTDNASTVREVGK